jgi:hypothetical protein
MTSTLPGPEYISRFCQEVQAVKLAARYDGSISSAAGSSIVEIGKQEVQQEAITAYYCWSVVKHVMQNLETDECRREAGNKNGKDDVDEQTAGVADVTEGREEGDTSKTDEEVGIQLGDEEVGDVGRPGEQVKAIATDGKKILDYITGIRIDTLFQVLLHKVQSRRIMCTEKLAYIESAIKLVRERTKDEETDASMDDLTLTTLPPIGPRTPIPSVCIDDGETDDVHVHEPSPEHVELKITGSESGTDASTDSMQVVYRKTVGASSPEIGLAGPSQRNGLNTSGSSQSNTLNTSLGPGTGLLGSEELNKLCRFASPSGSDDASGGASPGALADDDDYVEMDKLRAWAAARKRQSDFALMMFKDSFSYDNVPSEWYQMPASERYTQDYITMDILVNEKAQVTKQLEEVAFFVKVSDCFMFLYLTLSPSVSFDALGRKIYYWEMARKR